MSFHSLPKDLQNLISGFCWEITAKRMMQNLKTCKEIKKWNLHPLLLKINVWCTRRRDYVRSPLVVFRPIAQFGNSWKAVFDWSVVYEILHRLDFRKRVVKRSGSRVDWMNRMRSWRQIRWMDKFFLMMMMETEDPFKPTFKKERFVGMKWFLES